MAGETGIVPSIGYLGASADTSTSLVAAFREGLRQHGYVEGENVEVHYGLAALRPERYPALVREVLQARIDVIVTADSEATPVAQAETNSVPIVMSVSGDPVGEGLVASLDRPGGNVTGLTNLGTALAYERLALLREALPDLGRVAVLWNDAHPGVRLAFDETVAASRALGLVLESCPARTPDELAPAIDAGASRGAQALLVLTDRVTTFHRQTIVERAIQAGLPGLYG